jgi:hypothetical protein
MIGWMMIVFGLSAVSTAGSEVPQTPISLGHGVTITPAGGWTSASDIWQVGPDAVSLRRAGVLAAFAAADFDGTAGQLLDEQMSALEGQFGSFRTLPTSATTIDGGVPALKVLFSGTADSGRLDGEVVAAQSSGRGVVMLAVAPVDQMAQVQADLDAMLRSVVLGP